jgi:hypothetical protein
MRLVFFILTIGLVYSSFNSCIKPPDYGEVPVIEYKSISADTVNENTDSLIIVFSFTDGDGDVGPTDDQDSTINLFLIDSRDNSIKEYQLPNITPGGNVKAISGEVTVKVESFACQPGNEFDQMTYTIQIKDRAGHLSNTINTDPITIDCQ